MYVFKCNFARRSKGQQFGRRQQCSHAVAAEERRPEAVDGRESRTLAAVDHVCHCRRDEFRSRRPKNGPRLLHLPDLALGVLLRTPARGTNRLRQHLPGRHCDVLQPAPDGTAAAHRTSL